MREIPLSFVSEGLLLEAVLSLPAGPGPFPGAVVCHPHPLFGGNMENNVVLALARGLVDRGVAALRFNFRGVGRSQGSFGEGVGEQADAKAALAFLAGREEVDAGRLAVCGYSFGGMVALAVGCRHEKVLAVAAVSPVVLPGMLHGCSRPVFIMVGERDNLTPPGHILQEVPAEDEMCRVEVVPGADHFWWGHEEKLAGVAAFLAGVLR
ncbi:alpha/beta hydrolase [Desulfovirgula thermocuniculi]|uniref:alpha/beta hydrolase n=1 Tax=Desulfovirgula thermocuniculi TaxID=348842 RepID=UPI00041D0FB9|nr:alpha/beta fold hydrolase [Desulfovirgula thermocuniculi]